jgi:septum site-determining protein MinC
MIAKQKNLRVFYIQVQKVEDFLVYYEKNKILLKEFFLLLEGEVNKAIEDLLEKDGICFKVINGCNLKLLHVKKDLPNDEVKESKSQTSLFEKEVKEEKKKSIMTFNRPIRSGEEIHEAVPVSVFGRINSGAKLFCEQSVMIFGDIDGLVQCDGEYMICNSITPRGHVIFNGEIVPRELLEGNNLKKIELQKNQLVIKGIA